MDGRYSWSTLLPSVLAWYHQLIAAGAGLSSQRYSLQLITARLPKGSETSISMGFLVICVEKNQDLIRLFFSPYLGLAL